MQYQRYLRMLLQLLLCTILFACTSDTRPNTDPSLPSTNNHGDDIADPLLNMTFPHIIKEEDQIRKSFVIPTYPQLVPKVPYFFINHLQSQSQQYPIPCQKVKCFAMLSQLTDLADKDTMHYINQQVALHLEKWINKGFPKYPGTFAQLRNAKIISVNYIATIAGGINDIMKLILSTEVTTLGSISIYDKEYLYFDLHSGRELTINDIMNSKQGYEELNRLALRTIDAFVSADEIPDYTSMYQVPFQGKFEPLPQSTTLALDIDYSSIVLNDDCTNCHFSLGYSRIEPIHIWLNPNPIHLYQRYFNQDISRHVSDGTIVLDIQRDHFSHSYDSLDSIPLDKDLNLTIRAPSTAGIKPYLLKEGDVLMKELLIELKQAANTLGIALTEDNYDGFLSYSQGRLMDSIYIYYYIFDNEINVSGALTRNFHPTTHKQLNLSDMFTKQDDIKSFYQKLLQPHISQVDANITLEEILSEIDSFDFSIQESNLTISTKKTYQSKNSLTSYGKVSFYLTWEEIGLENMSSHLLEVKP